MRKLSLLSLVVSSSAMAHEVHGPVSNLIHSVSSMHHGAYVLPLAALATLASLAIGTYLVKEK